METKFLFSVNNIIVSPNSTRSLNIRVYAFELYMCYQPAFKYGFCVLAGLSCLAFLVFVSFENIKYGPRKLDLSFHVSNFTFKELRLPASQKNLYTEWYTTVTLFPMKPRTWASLTPTRGSAVVGYNGTYSISCGELPEHELGKELAMGVQNERSLHFFESGSCYFSNPIGKELGAKLRSDLDRKEVKLGLRFKIHAIFKNRDWSWADVVVTVFCDDLLVQFEAEKGMWLFRADRSKVCELHNLVVVH